MLGDIADIQATIQRAYGRFLAITDIDPNARAMILTSLAAKNRLLDDWLRGDWDDWEQLRIMEFIAAWSHEEIQIRKLQQHRELEGYLDVDWGTVGPPIPSLEIPKRT